MTIKLYPRFLPAWFALCTSLTVMAPTHAREEYYELEKNFEDLTQAEHTLAKKTAKSAKIRDLVACADPGNMPFSNIKEEGYDNRIARLLADALGVRLSFFWRPYLERGLHRETFNYKQCDLLLGMPEGYDGVLSTMPIYRSTYVFAYPEDTSFEIESLSDNKLFDYRIGTYQHSGLREALAHNGISRNVEVHVVRQDTDLVPEHQQWYQLMEINKGNLDLVGVWGPFAGYAQQVKGARVKLFPVNMIEERTPLEFSLAIGMRKNDVVLKYALDSAMQENADKIEALLREFGVPLVSCSDCVVQGDLPSHGTYYSHFIDEVKSRYLEEMPEERVQIDASNASPDQIVDKERVEKWLQEGADLNEELANAGVAGDTDRVRLLVSLGADINSVNAQGSGLMHNAARYRDSHMLEVLIELGADVNIRDEYDWTPLMHAAYSNHVPSLKILAQAGADLELENDEDFTALGVAIGERKFWAVKELVRLGANVNHPVGKKELSPLMIASIHRKADDRDRHIVDGAEPIEIATLLIEQGADVNARSNEDVTALMVASARDNSPMIALLLQEQAEIDVQSSAGKNALDYARENQSKSAIKSLELLMSFKAK